MTETVQSQKFKNNICNEHILPIIICAVAVPLSMAMWLFNVGYIQTKESVYFDDPIFIHPIRWLIASLISLTITIDGLKKKSLTISGAVLGFFVGFILTVASYIFLICLFTFFITSSKATKFRETQKVKLEDNHKEGGQRSWIHVLCNGGVCMALSLLYLLDVGSGERHIDFVKDYRPSWLAMGILGSLACCNGDTWASELATVLTTKDPYLITSRKKVPRGTNGGVTIIGIILSAVGGLVVAIANYIAILYFDDKRLLDSSPPQWPLLIVGFIGGLFGSLIDSFLGATLQYSGIDSTGRIVSYPGKGIKHICGLRILDNHSVNLISSLIMGLITPYIAIYIWPQ